jgi:hypothetical protein
MPVAIEHIANILKVEDGAGKADRGQRVRREPRQVKGPYLAIPANSLSARLFLERLLELLGV